ncbi:MAG: enoyl-CoA hydratase/carnithine racemase [Oceanicoccus sp.]|jgi:enoyl-CoA hydratase/carnithine racemase
MILTETSKGVRTITLNRPDALNAFNRAMWEALCQAITQAKNDNSAKVIIITGSGRAFSAGADLREKREGNEKNSWEQVAPVGVAQLVELLIDFPKPIIVAVNGLGVGIGATLCGLADITYMAASARLRCPFSSLGITAEGASTYTFSRLMGHQAASWFLLSAEWMDADQCKATHLAFDVFPDEGFLSQVMEKAEQLAAMPLASLIETKAMIMAAHKDNMRAANVRETEGLARLSGGPSNLEALRAFAEKRPADFSVIESER